MIILCVLEQGTQHTARTYTEWCEFIYYIPAALDGKLSIISEALRTDLAAVVQLLLHTVASTKGKYPFTSGSLRR